SNGGLHQYAQNTTTQLNNQGRDLTGNKVDVVWLGGAVPYTVPTGRTVSAYDNASFGSAIDIVHTSLGDVVHVGAPGKASGDGQLFSYYLTASRKAWTAETGLISGAPLQGSSTSFWGGFGSEVVSREVGSFSEAWAGMPAINLVGSIAPGSSFSSAIGGAPDSQFGADNAISAAGQKLVIGGPGGYGSLSVYSTPLATGAQPDLIFGGFYYDTAPSQLAMRPNIANPALANEGFGVGGQYVSEGFVLAGTNDATAYPNRIYNFRRRGPTFVPLRAADNTDVSTLMPALAPKAEAGSAVAIDGKLAVVGAPDYDNRGAVFVYAIDAADNWTLEAMLQPVGLKNGDRFGESVSISGERVIVGSPGWDHPLQGYDAGRVVMYERFSAETGSVAWLQQSEFTGPSQYGKFGTDVDLFGTTAIASQPSGLDSQRKVSVYSADAQGEWASTASFPGNSDSLAVSQDHIVIGETGG
ncbi:MAG: hypothetical protein ACO37F_13885, partial [Pirellulales bacterium]